MAEDRTGPIGHRTPEGNDVAVIGLGYVGTVTAACLASTGARVVGVEIEEQKVAAINAGRPAFSEPGLGELVELLRLVGGAQGFYELASTSESFDSITGLAKQLADEVERAQPSGTVSVGGWSFGGLVAFELARELRARKRTVSRLVLIDWVVSDMAEPDYDPDLAAVGALVRSVEASAGKQLPASEARQISDAFDREGLSLEAMLDRACALLSKHGIIIATRKLEQARR